MNAIKKSIWTRVAVLGTLALVLMFGLVSPAQAAVINRSGLIAAGETINDDVIIGAQRVTVDGTINGMLVAAGQTITISGTINGDVFAFGNTVVIAQGARIDGNLFAGAATVEQHGSVTGSVAVGGAALTMGPDSTIGRNVYFGGYSYELKQGSTLGRSLYAGAYQAMVKGDVARDVQLGVAAAELDGKIGGSAIVDLGNSRPGASPQFTPQMMMNYPGAPALPAAINPGLRIGPNAQITGSLTYTSTLPQSGGIQVQPAGGVVYQTPVPPQNPRTTNPPAQNPGARIFGTIFSWAFGTLRNLITLLLLGGLVVWLLPNLLTRLVDVVKTRPGPAAGYGLLSIIIFYIGAFVLAVLIVMVGLFFTVITLGGLSRTIFGLGFSSLALAVTTFTLLLSYVSKVIVAFLVGDWLIGKMAPNAGGRKVWAMLLGVLIYVLLRSIPFLGVVIGVAVTLLGIGAMLLVYLAWRNKTVMPVPEPVVPQA